MQEYVDFMQNHMLLSMAWIGIVVALIMNVIKSATAAYKEISPAELTQFINRDEGMVVDTRSRDEFKKGHITNSVNILPSDIKSGTISTLEKYKATPITVVCKTGTTAPESANLLAKAGFEKVFLLKGGLVSWDEAKMPLIRARK